MISKGMLRIVAEARPSGGFSGDSEAAPCPIPDPSPHHRPASAAAHDGNDFTCPGPDRNRTANPDTDRRATSRPVPGLGFTQRVFGDQSQAFLPVVALWRPLPFPVHVARQLLQMHERNFVVFVVEV